MPNSTKKPQGYKPEIRKDLTELHSHVHENLTPRVAALEKSDAKHGEELMYLSKQMDDQNITLGSIKQSLELVVNGLGLNDGDGSKSGFMERMVFIKEFKDKWDRATSTIQYAIIIAILAFLGTCLAIGISNRLAEYPKASTTVNVEQPK